MNVCGRVGSYVAFDGRDDLVSIAIPLIQRSELRDQNSEFSYFIFLISSTILQYSSSFFLNVVPTISTVRAKAREGGDIRGLSQLESWGHEGCIVLPRRSHTSELRNQSSEIRNLFFSLSLRLFFSPLCSPSLLSGLKSDLLIV